MEIRAWDERDLEFMAEMVFEAFFWDPSAPRPPLEEFRDDPDFVKILAEWGRAGDRAVIAEERGVRLGTAWFRLWTPELHSYGFVDAETPELGIAVAQGHRAKGLGRSLLRALVRTARGDGFPALSLSVNPSNPARHLYASEGFRKVGESQGAWILLLPLDPEPT